MPSLITNPLGKPPAALDPDVDALANFLSGQGMGPEDYQAPGVGTISAAAPPQTRAEAATPYEQEMSARAGAANAKDRERANAAVELSNYFTDLQEQKRADELKTKVAEAQAGPQATAAGQLAVEQEKARAAKEQLQMEQDFSSKIMGQNNGGTAGVGSEPQRFTVSGIGPSGKPTITAEKVPQQIQAQAHAAQVGLAQYPGIKQQILQAVKQGVSGPLMGPMMDQATSGALPGSLLSYLTSEQDQSAFKNLQTNLSLLKSNLAYAHGAARGGSSPAMQQRFDKLFNVNMSPAALQGAMSAAEKWLMSYAQATDNFTHAARPEDLASLDALDSELTGASTSELNSAPQPQMVQ